MTNPQPTLIPVEDKDGLMFEAYVLRNERGGQIFIGRDLADAVGGIEKVRRSISPHHMIVCEILK